MVISYYTNVAFLKGYFMNAKKLSRQDAEKMLINPLLAVLVSWLLVGLVEWPFMGASYAFQDYVTGLPGMMLMTLAGMVALKLKA